VGKGLLGRRGCFLKFLDLHGDRSFSLSGFRVFDILRLEKVVMDCVYLL
jgi:hypothetical protein